MFSHDIFYARGLFWYYTLGKLNLHVSYKAGIVEKQRPFWPLATSALLWIFLETK